MKTFVSIFVFIYLFLTINTAQAVDLKYGGSVTILEGIMKDAAPAFEKKTGFKIGMSGGDSGAGIKATLSGIVDIGGVSRDLSDDEKNQGLVPYTIGYDAVAVIVNKDIPIDNISSKTLKDIGIGQINNWKEIGGPELPIKVVIGPPAASARELFQKKILNDQPYTNNIIVSPVKNISETVSKIPGSIGILPLVLVDEKLVKVLKIDGVFPNKDSVKNRKYNLTRSLNLITKGPATGKAKEFIDFMLSPEGQAIVEKNGFVRVR